MKYFPLLSLPISLCAILACAQLAEAKIVIRDADNKMTATSYDLPGGWEGQGSILWKKHPQLEGNTCSRQLSMLNKKLKLRAFVFSRFETPSKGLTRDAEEISELLLPALKSQIKAHVSDLKLNIAYLSPVSDDTRDYLEKRDVLANKLGKKVECSIDQLSLVYSGRYEGRLINVVVGCIVHQREKDKGFFRKNESSATFHEVFIMGGDAYNIGKTLPELSKMLSKPRFNKKWTEHFICTLAKTYNGMDKIDPSAMPELRKRVESRIAKNLPEIISAVAEVYPAPDKKSK